MQLPWQRVTNPYAPMQILDEEQMDKLHRTSMRILSELGIRVMGEKVMGIFGAGTTLGPNMTWGFIAAETILHQNR